MMKKTYMTPFMETVKIASPVIMTGSNIRFNGDGTGTVEVTEDTPDEGEAMSRGFDWDF